MGTLLVLLVSGGAWAALAHPGGRMVSRPGLLGAMAGLLWVGPGWLTGLGLLPAWHWVEQPLAQACLTAWVALGALALGWWHLSADQR